MKAQRTQPDMDHTTIATTRPTSAPPKFHETSGSRNTSKETYREERLQEIGRREAIRFWTQKYLEEIKVQTKLAIRRKTLDFVSSTINVKLNFTGTHVVLKFVREPM